MNMDFVIIIINKTRNICSTIIDTTFRIAKLLETYRTSQLDDMSRRQALKEKTIINILEKIKILDKPINVKLAKEICVNISFHDFEAIIKCLKNDNLKDTLLKINQNFINKRSFS